MKVFVGMSGGVDSSVSAQILKKAGHDVTGVFIRTWTPDFLPCTWREERRDAIRVAAHIGIPLVTLNLEEEYKKGVIDYMIEEYRIGRTPNPDVMCNKVIKFGSFLEWSKKKGADKIATGHYARLRRAGSRIKGEGSSAVQGVELLRGVDREKDQSYFLWTLTQEQLEKSLFPVGEMHKSAVREYAKEHGLPVADKKDSQGLCFLGHVDMAEFLKHYIDVTPGDVLDESGKVIGSHEGAILYTLGQRHGFTTRTQDKVNSQHYVVARDTKNNILVVSPTPPGSNVTHAQKVYSLSNVNIIGELTGNTISACIRYQGKPQTCTIDRSTVSVASNSPFTIYTIFFKEPQVIAAGQSVVLYDGDRCLGGAVVE